MILLYHRVDGRDDPFALAVRPEWFSAHLDVLGARCRVVTLDEILEADPSSDEPLVAITFDDGYVDNLSVASPLLVDAGMPAAFFVCTGALGDARGFWWDRVATAVAAADAPIVGVEGLGLVLGEADLGDPGARTRIAIEVADRIRPLHPTTRDRIVEDLEGRLSDRAVERRAGCPILDEGGLRDLARRPGTTIGAHTHDHPKLSAVPRAEQVDQIARSVEVIRDVTGRRPRHLAYPYGSRDDYDDDSCAAAASTGMVAGYGNHGGHIDPVNERFRVPRYYVPPLPADGFERWLGGVMAS